VPSDGPKTVRPPSTASGTGTPIDDSTGGVDSGNNIGWLFIAGGTAGYSSTLLTLGVG